APDPGRPVPAAGQGEAAEPVAPGPVHPARAGRHRPRQRLRGAIHVGHDGPGHQRGQGEGRAGRERADRFVEPAVRS
ncbi:hypothetical protein COK69_26615, partial [Bacillus cereus]